MKPRVPTLAFVVVAVAIAATVPLVIAADATPKFEIDASWPKPLPNNWILGQIGGIFVDKDDNVWVANGGVAKVDVATQTASQPISLGCYGMTVDKDYVSLLDKTEKHLKDHLSKIQSLQGVKRPAARTPPPTR